MDWNHAVAIGFGGSCLFWFVVLLVAYIVDRKSFALETRNKLSQFILIESMLGIAGLFMLVGGILTL